MKIKSQIGRLPIKVLISISLAVIVLIGGALSFLADTDSKTNKFVITTLTLEVFEDGWEEDDNGDYQRIDGTNKNVMPLHSVKKAPVIKTPVINADSYLFMSVSIPSTNLSFEGEAPVNKRADGETLAIGVGDYYDLFSFKVNEGWSLVDVDVSDRNPSSSEFGSTTYYYTYSGELEYNEETNTNDAVPLFDRVTLANLVERPQDFNANTIDVTAFAIQKANIASAQIAWSLLQTQE